MLASSFNVQVVRVFAASLDIGVNAEIAYSIVGGNEHGKFTVDALTGWLTLAEPLDYERQREFHVTVQALDGGTPPLSNHAAVNVTVRDANDNLPVFSQVPPLSKGRVSHRGRGRPFPLRSCCFHQEMALVRDLRRKQSYL